MSDIVKRLKDAQGLTSSTAQADCLLWDAADIIEALCEGLQEAVELFETDSIELWRTVPDKCRASLAKAGCTTASPIRKVR
jgi:hypothetical protein